MGTGNLQRKHHTIAIFSNVVIHRSIRNGILTEYHMSKKIFLEANLLFQGVLKDISCNMTYSH